MTRQPDPEPSPAQDIPKVWRDILRPDEQILWQGAPQHAFRFKGQYIGTIIGAGIMLAIVMMNDVLKSDFDYYIFAGFFLVIAAPIGWDMFKLRHSFFTLTDQRAFIGLDLPIFGRRLNNYSVHGRFVPDLKHGRRYSTVLFDRFTKRVKNRTETTYIGFENLPHDEAQKVFALIKDLRNQTQ